MTYIETPGWVFPVWLVPSSPGTKIVERRPCCSKGREDEGSSQPKGKREKEGKQDSRHVSDGEPRRHECRAWK